MPRQRQTSIYRALGDFFQNGADRSIAYKSYVLPAYLRQYLLRPDFMCMDSIFHCMDYTCKGQHLLSLSAEQKAAVQDVLNEFRCREQQINGDVEETLLPWEYERYRQEGGGASPWTFAGNQTLEYAERHGIPY